MTSNFDSNHLQPLFSENTELYQVGDIVRQYNLTDSTHYLIIEIFGVGENSICECLCLETGEYINWRYENIHIFCRKVA
jgi:hypothetical protein